MVHDRGPLWWALRSSIWLAGVMPPVYAGGGILVDGGAVNVGSIDLMRKQVQGSVIAVNLRGGKRKPFDEIDPPSRVGAPSATGSTPGVARLGSPEPPPPSFGPRSWPPNNPTENASGRRISSSNPPTKTILETLEDHPDALGI